MIQTAENSLDELVRAGALLTKDLNFKKLIAILVEQSIDITRSDLCCLYLHVKPFKKSSDLRMSYKRGNFPVPLYLKAHSELIDFLHDCYEAVLLLERKESPFADLLLSPTMQSGIALPLSTNKGMLGVLILNSTEADFYNRKKFSFLESFTNLAEGVLHNSMLYQELKDYLKEIEELKLYQESIFSSMTNLLVTTDDTGRIRYYNRAAEDRLGITQDKVGKTVQDVFEPSVDKGMMKIIDNNLKQPKDILGVEGNFKTDSKNIDFSLNMSPLKGQTGNNLGLTFLFTDQTKERELKEQVDQIVEERRVIKNMFSRYLSQEIVQKLMEDPNLVKPGGDKKNATILFADIRGYTSFSEGKDPKYIIEILNEFFGMAVEVIIKHKGYIDKFIGDCIMAAWGVPLWTEKEDAIHAVTCALEIQKLVASEARRFFVGEASKLKVGIGMHTGALVAGNLGSAQRMNYTVIGDTVNIAARLEGVAKAGDIIITQNTRNHLDDLFNLEKLIPVSVKGKSKPIPIYNVLSAS